MPINRLLLAVMIVWSIPSSTNAEPEKQIAVKGGLGISSVTEDNQLSRRSRYGLSGGVAGSLHWPLVERYLLAGQVELLYAQRGSQAFFEDEYIGTVRTHYAGIALAARPEVRLGTVRVYLLLGGTMSFLLSANTKNASGMTRDVTGDLHRTDLALLAGAGVAWHLLHRRPGPLRLGTIFVEVRHDHGLSDLDAVIGGFKNRSSSLMLGLSFAVGPPAPRRVGPRQPREDDL